MFPFCSHPTVGSRLADLRLVATCTQGRNSSPRGDDGHGFAPGRVRVVLILVTAGVI